MNIGFDVIYLYVIAAAVVALLVVVCCVTGYFKWYIIDRTKVPNFILPIRYFTEHPDVELDDIQFKSTVSKIRKRKQRLRRLNAILRAKSVAAEEEEEWDIEEQKDDDSQIQANESGSKSNVNTKQSVSTRSMSLRRSMLLLRASFLNFLSFNDDSQEAFSSRVRESPSMRSTRKKSRQSSLLLSGGETSTKSKRFISQDRLDRLEARKALAASQTKFDDDLELEEIPEDELDESARRRKEIIERRKENRREIKSVAAMNGIVDPVALNAGPLPNEVPKGFSVVEFIPDLDPENLVYKRVLYKYENPATASGWFLGTIVGTSKVPGKNFNIKYDRAETGTRFVDGMETVSLTMEGENAYGRRWVIIE